MTRMVERTGPQPWQAQERAALAALDEMLKAAVTLTPAVAAERAAAILTEARSTGFDGLDNHHSVGDPNRHAR